MVSASATFAVAQQQFPATLAGHAVLPAESFIAAPGRRAGRPQDSGKFTTRQARRGARHGDGQVLGRRDRRQAALQGPAAAGPFGHQEDAATARSGCSPTTASARKANSPDFDALSQPLRDRLGGGHVRAARDGLPARPGQEGAVPHRPRGHREALPDGLGFRPRELPVRSATSSGSATSSAPT